MAETQIPVNVRGDWNSFEEMLDAMEKKRILYNEQLKSVVEAILNDALNQ